MTGATMLSDPQMEAGVSPVPEQVAPETTPETGGVPDHVVKHVLHGTAALGLGITIERGMGFVANVLAARFGGSATFGAYSLAITTANNISTYAAGGIGSTAARFSGKYGYGTASYGTLARVLAIVSVVSALVAAGGLWLGAVPLSHLLHKESLTGLLQWAAISAAGIIVLECARGFFVGQRRLAALVLLSLMVGVGMLVLVPLAAHARNPVRMIVTQGLITMTAVLACLLLARPLGLLGTYAGPRVALGPMLREVWSFGFVQLAGLIGVNLAGWWLTTLIARADTTLVQMGFFAIASQLRNIVALVPSLLTEGSYASMADPDGRSRTPQHLMALCGFASTVASLVLAAVGIVIVPWMLKTVYGRAYGAAGLVTSLGLAVAITHMGNAPAAARLSIVSIKAAGVINTVWAVFVAGAATLFLLHGGSAAGGMGIYLGAHVLSAGLVMTVLAWRDRLPEGTVAVFLLGVGSSLGLAGLAYLRASRGELAGAATGAMVVLVAVAGGALMLLGGRRGWLPDRVVVGRGLRSVRGMFLGGGR